MKTRQRTLRTFEIFIDKKDDFVDYINKNQPILKEFLLLLDGEVDDEIEYFLNSLNITFLNIKKSPIFFKEPKKASLELEPIEIKVEPHHIKIELEDKKDETEMCEKSQKSEVIYRNIRSGEKIENSGDVIIFGRINSGAEVIATGNIIAFGEIDGEVTCHGEVLIIKNINLGRVIFQDNILQNSNFQDGKLKKVKLINGLLEIKDIYETKNHS